jgi:hypothetical protein
MIKPVRKPIANGCASKVDAPIVRIKLYRRKGQPARGRLTFYQTAVMMLNRCTGWGRRLYVVEQDERMVFAPIINPGTLDPWAMHDIKAKHTENNLHINSTEIAEHFGEGLFRMVEVSDMAVLELNNHVLDFRAEAGPWDQLIKQR